MRMMLALGFLIAFSASAAAQGNTITVKNADGTVSTVDIGPQPDLPPLVTPQKSATPAPKVAPKKAEPKKAAAKPAKKPAPPKKLANKKAEKKVEKKSAAKKTAKKPAKKSQKKQSVPAKTAAKPAPAPVKSAPPAQATPTAQRLGPNMTSDDAIRIALDAAPPARSVHAYPVNYKGLHAYQVVFRTEDGDRSLFVDRESGKLVK